MSTPAKMAPKSSSANMMVSEPAELPMNVKKLAFVALSKNTSICPAPLALSMSWLVSLIALSTPASTEPSSEIPMTT